MGPTQTSRTKWIRGGAGGRGGVSKACPLPSGGLRTHSQGLCLESKPAKGQLSPRRSGCGPEGGEGAGPAALLTWLVLWPSCWGARMWGRGERGERARGVPWEGSAFRQQLQGHGYLPPPPLSAGPPHAHHTHHHTGTGTLPSVHSGSQTRQGTQTLIPGCISRAVGSAGKVLACTSVRRVLLFESLLHVEARRWGC